MGTYTTREHQSEGMTDPKTLRRALEKLKQQIKQSRMYTQARISTCHVKASPDTQDA